MINKKDVKKFMKKMAKPVGLAIACYISYKIGEAVSEEGIVKALRESEYGEAIFEFTNFFTRQKTLVYTRYES